MANKCVRSRQVDSQICKRREFCCGFVSLRRGKRRLEEFLDQFFRNVLTKVARRGALHDIFEQILGKRTQSPSFVNDLETRDLTSFHFCCTEFICVKLEKETHLDDNTGRKRVVLSLSAPMSPCVSDSSIEVKLCEQATRKIRKTEKTRDDEGSGRSGRKK